MSNYVKRLFFAGVILSVLFTLAIIGVNFRQNTSITIGSKIETENHILAEMIKLMIEAHTNLKVHHIADLEGTLVCFNALCSKDIDLYIEYTGTALTAILKEDLKENVAFIRDAFAKRFDIAWLEGLGFENSYGLFTKNKHYQKFSQLAEKNITFGVDPEFSARDECKILMTAYDLHFDIMDQDLLFLGNHDVIVASSTDARTKGFCQLEDNDQLFPHYEPAPIVRYEVLKHYPKLKSVLLSCKNLIKKDEMMLLNIEVDLNHKNPYDVALDYLKSKGFL